MRKTFTYEGKRYEVTGKTQKELDDKYFYKRLALETKCSESVYTVSEWTEIWLETYKKPAVNEYNYNGYVYRVRLHICPQIGDKRLSDVTLRDCQKLINLCSSFSETYISKIFFTLKSIFSTAVKEGLIDKSPTDGLIKPKGKRMEERRSLTPCEKELAKAAIEVNPHGLYFGLMLYCGLRPYECGFIQGKDIQNGKLHVRGTKTKNSDRWVVVPTVLVLPELAAEEFLFPHLTNQKKSRWWQSFKRDMNIIGGCKLYRNKLVPPFVVPDDLTPYCFRHTYCTDLEEAGVPVNIARQLMGHSNINITTQVYTHTSEESWNLAISKINSFHSSSTSIS